MDGIQRLAEMIKGQKDKSLIKIVSYLMLQKDMEQDFLKEEKDLKEMAEYIKGLAKKEAVNGVAIIEDEIVSFLTSSKFERLSVKTTCTFLKNEPSLISIKPKFLESLTVLTQPETLISLPEYFWVFLYKSFTNTFSIINYFPFSYISILQFK